MSDYTPELSEALEQFDRGSLSKELAAADKEREKILSRFPIVEWPTMELTRYAIGHDAYKESFCWHIEFDTPNLGSIKGGSSNKLLIYYAKKASPPAWQYPERYKTEADAWQDIRSGFVQALDLASKDQIEAITEIESLQGASALLNKTLATYFPDKLIPIHSAGHLKWFLNNFGVEDGVSEDTHTLILNRKLCDHIGQSGLFDGWSLKEIQAFLYQQTPPPAATVQRVLKVSPGQNANLWDDCLGNGYIRIGWDAVGDLREYTSKSDFMEAFHRAYLKRYNNSAAATTRKANEVWMFYQLAPGDLVVANQGISRVLGVGTVVSPGYQFDEGIESHRHTVSVEWDTSLAKQIPPQKGWPLVTVKKLNRELQSIILGTMRSPRLSAPQDEIFPEIEAALERKRQIILYGPPGTGKTYTARRFAAWWLSKKMNYPALGSLETGNVEFQAREKEFGGGVNVSQSANFWWFTTDPKVWDIEEMFSASSIKYSYGRIKENYEKVKEGDLAFGYVASPNQRIAVLAQITRGLHHPEGSSEPKIEMKALCRISNGLTYSDMKDDPTLTDSEPIKSRCQGTLFRLSNDEGRYLLKKMAHDNPQLRSYLPTESIVPHLSLVTFHASYSYEDFIEGFRPVPSESGQLTLQLEDGVFKRFCDQARANPDAPFLMIVDEINRANVAKVLGELITLLEVDKRGLTVTLPQSKTKFSIPPNVYIIATMNTADRSIKLLDAALRRRFAFVEVMPDQEILAGAKIENLRLDYFLDTLNSRIANREGREKQIGHAYLLKDGAPVTDQEEFAVRFKHDILPLLQEYCYDDYATLSDFVGGALVRDGRSLDYDILNDPHALISQLAKEFPEPKDAE